VTFASAILAGLPDAATVVDAPPRRVGRGGVSFSDDLSLFGGDRLAVRVRITDADTDGAWVVDLRDSDVPTGMPAFALSTARTRVAVALAFGHALGGQGPVDVARLQLLVEPGAWSGCTTRSSARSPTHGPARSAPARARWGRS
jgi:hypothetical protein